MDNYEKYKKAYYKKHHLVKRKYKFVNKLLVLGILFVGVLITVKVNPTAASWVKTHVYMDNFSFAQIENWYNKYIGGIFSSNDDEVTQVFSGTIPYTSLEPYYDGVRLKVSSGSVVESLLSGIIVSIGETEHYGNTSSMHQRGVEAERYRREAAKLIARSMKVEEKEICFFALAGPRWAEKWGCRGIRSCFPTGS